MTENYDLDFPSSPTFIKLGCVQPLTMKDSLMEIARRARFIRACFCAVNVAVSILTGMTGFAIAALVGIVAFYMPAAFGKFTAFTLGYVGVAAFATGGAPALVMVTAAWAVLTLVWWLITGFRSNT